MMSNDAVWDAVVRSAAQAHYTTPAARNFRRKMVFLQVVYKFYRFLLFIDDIYPNLEHDQHNRRKPDAG
jgi:hypothetical protein